MHKYTKFTPYDTATLWERLGEGLKKQIVIMPKIRGYTFLEIAIVVLIISTISIIIISTLKIFLSDKKATNTTNKLVKIEEEIAKYFKQYKQLPCPNNPFAENIKSDDCNCPNALKSNNLIYYGTIPADKLKLTQDYLYDGYNKQILFTIDRNFSCAENIYGATGKIEILDVNNQTISKNAIYSLVSYGKNGFGSYDRAGKESKSPINEKELENSDKDHQFIFSYIRNNNNYDDYVYFKTKEQLLIASNISNNAIYQNPLKNSKNLKIWLDVQNPKTIPQSQIEENPIFYDQDEPFMHIYDNKKSYYNQQCY